MPQESLELKLGDLAAEAGLARVHLLAWRDLADAEAGGSEIHAARIAERWARAGLEVTMRTSYAPGHAADERRDGYRVLRRAGRYLVFPRAVASELTGRHGPADAVVEIWNGMPFLTPLWCRRPSVVVLHHVHAEMWRMVLGDTAPWLATAGEMFERRIAPLLYHRSRVVTLSLSARHEIVDMLRLRPGQIDVVPPGIDSRFNPGGERTGWPSIAAVGRLVPVKRYELLLRAAVEARQRVPDLTLTIVGEGYERPRLGALVRELDAEAWVTFAGRVSESDLVELYRRSWLVASASAREGWGMTLTEAAACGTPAVATRIAGHVDAVAEGMSGLLAGASATELGGAMARVLVDHALRQRLGQGAIEHAARFDWDATAVGVFRALAAEARRRR